MRFLVFWFTTRHTPIKKSTFGLLSTDFFDGGFGGRILKTDTVIFINFFRKKFSFVRKTPLWVKEYFYLLNHMARSAIASRIAGVSEGKARGVQDSKKRLPLKRVFTKEGVHPFDQVAWKKVKVTVRGSGMNVTTEERELEFPESWSDNATSIAGSKYFRGRIGSDGRETSARQMIGRVVGKVRDWGLRFGHFGDESEASAFADELTYILLHQKAAFNSPVWFNVGVEEKPQCSACFLLAVEDNMQSIMEWIRTEAMIFKGGSGSGVNLSNLRSSSETLSAGGRSSGPVSFMRGADAVAAMIASGGSTRRAAKMVVMNIDHPDIMKFIRCKADEEKKVDALIEAGYNMYDLNDPAWNSIQYQNANNSVRVTDEFMHAVENDETFATHYIQSGKVAGEYRARDLMYEIAKAAWESGDPGMQYDTTINRWHTNPVTGRITTSNPRSEYPSLADSACSLSSINVLTYPDRKKRQQRACASPALPRLCESGSAAHGMGLSV